MDSLGKIYLAIIFGGFAFLLWLPKMLRIKLINEVELQGKAEKLLHALSNITLLAAYFLLFVLFMMGAMGGGFSTLYGSGLLLFISLIATTLIVFLPLKTYLFLYKRGVSPFWCFIVGLIYFSPIVFSVLANILFG